MSVFPAGGSDGRGRIDVGQNLHIPPTEHSRTVHCNQDHCGPVSGGVEASGFKGGQAVVGTKRLRHGRDADGGSRGGTDGGVGGDGRGGNKNGLNRWEYTVVNIILGT